MGLSLTVPMALSQAQSDLPYTSPSTGTDGPLVIPDALPAFGDFDAPISAIYDTTEGRLLALGRQIPHDSNSAIQDSVLYAFSNGTWELIAGDNNELGYTMVHDPVRGETLRVGYYSDFFENYYGTTEVLTGSGWEYKADLPYSMALSSLAYDEAREAVILFGGYNDSDGALGHTLVWDGTAWTEVAVDAGPSPRVRPAMAFDPVRQEVVLFGGNDSEYSTSSADFEDTWTWDGTTWTEESPTNIPPNGYPAMAWDPNRNAMLLVVNNGAEALETWEWDGSDWTQLNPPTVPPVRRNFGLVYDPDRNGILLLNGDYEDPALTADTWLWDGSDWSRLAVSPYVFDLSEKPDGIWNFTSIYVGQTDVRFKKNAANTPVVWHATEEVVIKGNLFLNGEDAVTLTPEREPNLTPAAGGPGGYDGGLGGYYVTADGADQPGRPGDGPGGGLPSYPGDPESEFDGRHGTHLTRYGSPGLQDLRGGSGGGGTATSSYSAENDWGLGGNGGGGGGAILITSSRDIRIIGSIEANGGWGSRENYKRSSSSFFNSFDNRGGSGSGGAIRLVADRVFGLRIYAETDANTRHDYGTLAETGGIVRIESYFNTVYGFRRGDENYFFTQPRETLSGADRPLLRVQSIAGQAVPADPGSDPAAPEVTFPAAGEIQIVVAAENLADGRLLSLRVVSGSEVVEPEPVALSGGSATFTLTVPAGAGKVWAWTTWEVQP